MGVEVGIAVRMEAEDVTAGEGVAEGVTGTKQRVYLKQSVIC